MMPTHVAPTTTTTTAATGHDRIGDDARHERHRARWSTLLVVAIAAAAIPLLFVLHQQRTSPAPRAQGDARATTSYAIGLSAGAALRGVVDARVDAFRRGLVDGLADDARHTSVMSRPERFARLREAMRRLSEAEIAAVSSRLDESADH